MESSSIDTMVMGIAPERGAPGVESHRVVALSGDARPHSRTSALASAVAVRIAREIVGGSQPDASWRLIELRDGEGATARPTGEEESSLARASVVVVASPVRRGSYTGHLKLFCDRLPDAPLAGAIAIPVMVAPTHRHAMAADVHLRPLLIELGASCPTPSLFALESRLTNPGAVCGAWFGRARPALEHLAGRI